MFSVTILGNNSAIPAYNRHPTSQAVQNDEQIFLVDCGEGTQSQIMKYKIRHSRLNNILISHLHGDHYFGLIGLLTSMALLGRKNELNLYAPPELLEIIHLQLKVAAAHLPYSLKFKALNDDTVLYEDKKIIVESFRVYHRIPCWGFIFREKKYLRKINPEKVKEYEIPTHFLERLHFGEDYIKPDHTIVKNELLTLEVAPSRAYAFCADTLYNEDLAEKVKGVNLLYHEATYLDHLREKATSRFHSTSKQAASIAKLAQAEKLLLGHFSSQYETLELFLSEAREIFPNTELAEEGTCFYI
ncbi:MAG: ribonuclease Z [Ginsengibacter sp.]